MKNEMQSMTAKPNAIRITVTIIGVLFGISGINHGLFEILQGNRPTGKSKLNLRSIHFVLGTMGYLAFI